MAGIREILRKIRGEAWERWYGGLYLHALKLTRNSADAEDAVSEAFRRAIRADPSLSSEGHARNYLRRTISNVVADTYTKRRKRKALLKEFGLSRRRRTPSPLDALIADAESARIKAIINKALAEMDEKVREALELYYDPKEKMTFRDIAEAQEVSVRTAHKRVQEGVDLIAKAIEEAE